jgi:L-ascorbate metabolism protein UlaG (beta-lactamase superfamily)
MSLITYLEHSGFAVNTETALLVFDYYQDPSGALAKLLETNSLPVIFFVSHHHPDHFNRSIFNIDNMPADVERYYIISNDVFARNIPEHVSAVRVKNGDTLTDLPGHITVKVFNSTDIGVSYLVTLPNGETIFHAGDLNNWHWADESTDAEIKSMEKQFMSILAEISSATNHIDIAFFPVDARLGKNYALGAAQFLQKIEIGNFFPMHFWGKADEACNIDAYPLNQPIITHFHAVKQPGTTFAV